MPLPKHRTSRARRNQSRTHKKTEPLDISVCSHCGEAKLPHMICKACGYYNDRLVMEKKEKES
ncbi:MAG: 50S ribosomal protein L32 [Desulfobacterales bacterium]|nr:50S ribosomal protein L32 [Desulfobacterales bacterium]